MPPPAAKPAAAAGAKPKAPAEVGWGGLKVHKMHKVRETITKLELPQMDAGDEVVDEDTEAYALFSPKQLSDFILGDGAKAILQGDGVFVAFLPRGRSSRAEFQSQLDAFAAINGIPKGFLAAEELSLWLETPGTPGARKKEAVMIQLTGRRVEVTSAAPEIRLPPSRGARVRLQVMEVLMKEIGKQKKVTITGAWPPARKTGGPRSSKASWVKSTRSRT